MTPDVNLFDAAPDWAFCHVRNCDGKGYWFGHPVRVQELLDGSLTTDLLPDGAQLRQHQDGYWYAVNDGRCASSGHNVPAPHVMWSQDRSYRPQSENLRQLIFDVGQAIDMYGDDYFDP